MAAMDKVDVDVSRAGNLEQMRFEKENGGQFAANLAAIAEARAQQVDQKEERTEMTTPGPGSSRAVGPTDEQQGRGQTRR
jgi:hypothetical protein